MCRVCAIMKMRPLTVCPSVVHSDPKKYSFPLQIYLLNNRFRQVPMARHVDTRCQCDLHPVTVALARTAATDHLVRERRHSRSDNLRRWCVWLVLPRLLFTCWCCSLSLNALNPAKMLRDSGRMEERDYQTYLNLFANMSNFMVPGSV